MIVTPEDLDDDIELDDDNSPYLTTAEYRSFKRHVEGLNKLITQLRERYPDAQYYLACSMRASLHIMSGDPHSGSKCDARQDRIIETLTIEYADAGDW